MVHGEWGRDESVSWDLRRRVPFKAHWRAVLFKEIVDVYTV